MHRRKSGDFSLSANYIDAIRSVGGVPLLLPPGETQVSAVLQILDGVVLSGGGDLDPSVYGGGNHPEVKRVCAERDGFEIALARQVMAYEIPVLGICRGMQLLSVVSGGRLHPHVPERFGEMIAHYSAADLKPTRHNVQVLPDTRLAQITQLPEFSVVSWHHQAIESVPLGWQVAAYSDDDLIEAIEHVQHPWAVAIQWHPEFSATEPGHRQIFEAFMNAVIQLKQQRAQ